MTSKTKKKGNKKRRSGNTPVVFKLKYGLITDYPVDLEDAHWNKCCGKFAREKSKIKRANRMLIVVIMIGKIDCHTINGEPIITTNRALQFSLS